MEKTQCLQHYNGGKKQREKDRKTERQIER